MNENVGKCKNCGAEYGLHHYRTGQCPVGGCEAPLGKTQEYMETTFEIEKVDPLMLIAKQLERIADALEDGNRMERNRIPF